LTMLVTVMVSSLRLRWVIWPVVADLPAT